jgi:folate-dependent phosphoribosylglycinamide formyltransferase PurN
MPGIVVLTAGGDYAARLLLGLGVRGVVPEATFVAPHLHSRGAAVSDGLRRNASPRRFSAAVLRRMLSRVDDSLGPDGFVDQWSEFSKRVEVMASVNDGRTEAAIREISPEYLILAGCPIVRANILALPSRGTINVHPGLLPWIRGVHVVEHAVERRVPVGVTAHFVNAGIDTGNIIRRELIPVGHGDTLRSLRHKSSERCTELLIELAAGVTRGEHPHGLEQQTRFPYCKWLRDAQIREIDAKVATGEAMELHASWSQHFGSEVIPLDRDDYPEIATPPLAEAAR